jgi:hypothetical protein
VHERVTPFPYLRRHANNFFTNSLLPLMLITIFRVAVFWLAEIHALALDGPVRFSSPIGRTLERMSDESACLAAPSAFPNLGKS